MSDDKTPSPEFAVAKKQYNNIAEDLKQNYKKIKEVKSKIKEITLKIEKTKQRIEKLESTKSKFESDKEVTSSTMPEKLKEYQKYKVERSVKQSRIIHYGSGATSIDARVAPPVALKKGKENEGRESPG